MGAQEGLLERVLALLLGAEHVAAESEQREVVPVVDDLEGALIAGRGQLGEAGVVEPSGTQPDERGSDCGRCHLHTHLPTLHIGSGWPVVKPRDANSVRRRFAARRDRP
jgi:hypothetical protein